MHCADTVSFHSRTIADEFLILIDINVFPFLLPDVMRSGDVIDWIDSAKVFRTGTFKHAQLASPQGTSEQRTEGEPKLNTIDC